MLIIVKFIHLLAMAIGIGGGIASMILALRARSAAPEIRAFAGPTQAAIGRVSFVCLILLWLTGIWLLVRAGGLAAMPAIFWLKLLAVLALTGAAVALQVLAHRAARGTPPDPKLAMRLGMTANASSLLALICAVIAFA